MAKRSQLEVGQEWAYARGRNHYIGGYFTKVTIVAVEPMKQWRYGEIVKAHGGLGVHVQVHERFQGEPRIINKVVQLSQLWIPWAEYEVQKAEYVEAEKIRQEKAKIAKAENEKFKEEIFYPALREFFAVIKPFAGNSYVSGWTRIEELPIEAIKAITEAMKEKAVA